MLPETHPLIEAATEPLAKNAEQRLAANDMLGRNFDPKHPAVEALGCRLKAGVGRGRFVFAVVLWLLAVAAVATVIVSNAPAIRIAETILNFNLFEPVEKPILPKGLTEEERLILGDPELSDLEQKQRLNEFAPENPAYYAEYAQQFGMMNGALPPNFLETVEQIAPENAFFLYYAAGRLGADCIDKKRLGSSPLPSRFVDGVRLSPLPREMEFEILDEEAFEEALALIKTANSKNEFETFTNQMIRARSRPLPIRNIAEFMRSLAYSYGTSTGIIQLRYIADLLSARAEQLSKKGREAEFIELAAQRDAFIVQLLQNPDVLLVGELVNRVIVAATATNFRFAAERLELDDLANRYREQSDAIQEERDLRQIRDKKEPEVFSEEEASILVGLAFPMVKRQVNTPVPFSESDFKPMRMAEHELVGKVGIFAVVLSVIVVAFVLFLFRLIFPAPIRVPAKRLSAVLGWKDGLWVLALGIVIPVLIFLIVTRLTPLSGREYGAQHFLFCFPSIHLIALLLSLLIAPALVVRWRLDKHLAPLGLGDRFTIPVALGVLAVLLAWSLTALPTLLFLELSDRTLMLLAAPLALCLSLIVAHALRSILGKPSDRLLQCTAAVAVLPSYAVAIVVLCLLTPIYTAAESRWIAKDTLFRIDPDAPDLGAYEFKVAAQIREETKALLDME
ncbi:MAG: hypothetical protein AB8D78_12415 [Akkermansiaceae bacterium]